MDGGSTQAEQVGDRFLRAEQIADSFKGSWDVHGNGC